MKGNNKFLFEPLDDEITKIVVKLKDSFSVLNKNRCYFFFVYGKQNKNEIKKISTLDGVDLISMKFYAPKFLKLFSFLISGYSALIRLNNLNSIDMLMEKMTNLSMAGLFSFDSSYEESFLNYYNNNNYKTYSPEEYIKKDSSHFCLMIDGDNIDTETGVLGIASYGEKCPNELKDIFKNYGEYGYIGQKPITK